MQKYTNSLLKKYTYDADNNAEDSEVSFMNSIQPNSVFTEKSMGHTHNSSKTEASKIVSVSKDELYADKVSKVAANDEIVAKVLSFALAKSMATENSVTTEKVTFGSKTNETKNNDVIKNTDSTEQLNASVNFDIEKVASNVTNFVTSALSKLAKSGHSKDQVEFFRNEAITGVAVGVDQAKLELVGLVNDDVFKKVDTTKDAIIEGITSFRVEYNKQEYENQDNHNRINFFVESGREIQLNFDASAFSQKQFGYSNHSITTNASNISISVSGDISKSETNDISNLINRADDVLDTFYRKDVESAYDKSEANGYSNNELLSLSLQIGSNNSFNKIQAYEQIQHVNEYSNSDSLDAPKAVAQYLNKYMHLVESSKSALKTEEDFNQIINGLVNQMKDVQVPDILQAINRFHAFNKKFGS